MRCVIAILAVILAGAMAVPADAQERSRRQKPKKSEASSAATAGERVEDWVVRCEPAAAGAAKRCEMVQLLSARDGRKDLLLMRLAYPPAEKGAVALIVVPLDVLLPPGLGLRIDQREPIAVPIRHCETSGCVAPWRPGPDDLAALRSGKELLVLLRDREGRQLGLPVSLKGFSTAHDRLQ